MRCLILVFALVLLGLTGGGSAAVLHSGLYGTVMRGPTTPVCVVGRPCSEPAVGSTLVFSRAGRLTRVVVREHGAYRVLLAPGLYTVRTLGRWIGRGVEPVAVRVLPKRMRHVDFAIDTGIR